MGEFRLKSKFVCCGLDPSLLGCTISFFNEKKILDFLYIHIESGLLLDRIYIIQNLIIDFFIQNDIKYVIIETPYYNRFNPKTFAAQMRLYQQLINIMIVLDIEFSEKNANTIKKYVIKGRAKKEQMKEFFIHNISLRNSLNFEKLTSLEQEGIIDSLFIGMQNNKLADFIEK